MTRRPPLIRWLNCACVVIAMALGCACQQADSGDPSNPCGDAEDQECGE